MPGHNHFPNCTCGWCRGGGWGGGGYRGAPSAALPAVGTRTTWSCDDFCRPTTCPRCGAQVFFVRHNGGSVWFDELGPPWPKHACFFDDLSGVRLRTQLAKAAKSDRPSFFGIVTETVVTEPGKKGRIVVRCSDGRVIDDEFTSTSDLTRYSGSLVVIEESVPGRYILQRVYGDDTVIEVWDCPRMHDVLIYDPRAQSGVDRTESRFWMWYEARWTELSDFNIQPRLRPLTGQKATRLAYKYAELRPVPPYTPATKGPAINLGALLWHLQHGTNPTATPARNPVEVVIFAGTPAERRFNLPGTVSAERIAAWIKDVESARSGRAPGEPQA